MVGAGSWGPGHSVRPEGRNEEQTPGALGAWGDSWVPSRPTPLTRYTLWRCALAPAVLRECMYFLAGILTENREGGEQETSVFGARLSPPPHYRRHLHGRRRAVASTASRGGCFAALLVLRSVSGEAGAAPGAHLPLRNIIPGQFRLPEREGAAGRGGDQNWGRRFQPGSSSPTQRLPRTARGGGRTEGCAVYPEGCMLRGNGPPRSQIF